MAFFNKKDILIISSGVIICVFVFFFVSFVINKISPTRVHDNLITDVRQAAYKYALDNISYFEQGYEMYISVDSLVTNGYLKKNSNEYSGYVDNITGLPFSGLIYIYYLDNKIHTDYIEDFSKDEIEELVKKDLSIITNNITTNSINISIDNKNLIIDKYEYYLNDIKVTESNSNNYEYSNLTYGIYQIKVIGYSNNNSYETKNVIALKQLVKPTIQYKNKTITVKYPNNTNNYVYEYKIDNGEWIVASNQIESVVIDNNCSFTARVFDGVNYVTEILTISDINIDNDIIVDVKEYEVNFDLNGGSGKIKTQKVSNLSFAIEPITVPTKTGYNFAGWYYNDKLYNFNTPVKSNITLVAKWTLKESKMYSVNFNLNGGLGNIRNQLVPENTLLSEPTSPRKTGYVFKGWYYNNKLYDFNTPVKSDLMLTAKWVEEEIKLYTVKFDLNGGSGNIRNQSVKENTLVNQPSVSPIRNGYKFVGWYYNNKLYNFNIPVQSNITLVAKWVLNEVKTYTVKFDLNGGTGNIFTQYVEENYSATIPITPTRKGYKFVGWYYNNKLYSFNAPIQSNITLVAKWEEKVVNKYTIKFDLNGGTGNIQDQYVDENKFVSKPVDPTRNGYKFNGWYLNNKVYDFGISVNNSFTLKAGWTVEKKESVIPIIKYNHSTSSGKWIFINNPERLSNKYLTDNSGKALYSDYFSGNAEIYYEHSVQAEVSLKMKYGIRFYNPTSSTVTLKINKCGIGFIRGDGSLYIKTWKEYYGFTKCNIVNQQYTIQPGKSIMLYQDVINTGTGWSDWTSTYTTVEPKGTMPESVFDGVLNVTSNGKLNVESFAFKNSSTIPQKSYDKSDNYIDNQANKLVYSGSVNKLPIITTDIKFTINNDTPKGPLKVKYSSDGKERTEWYTHNTKDGTDLSRLVQNDIIKPIMTNNTAENWGNWTVHYTENIIIKNNTGTSKKLAYYVNSLYADEVNKGTASAVVSFVKNKNINNLQQRNIIGMWHTTNKFEKVWEVTVPANSEVTIPTEVLLGGNSSGTIGRKVELLN